MGIAVNKTLFFNQRPSTDHAQMRSASATRPFAQWNLIRVLATFQIIGEARKQEAIWIKWVVCSYFHNILHSF